MAIYKTAGGYSIRFYGADGRERQRTFKGLTRDEALRKERQLLKERDEGELHLDERHAPSTRDVRAERGLKNGTRAGSRRPGRSPSQVLKSQLRAALRQSSGSPRSRSREVRQAITSWQDGGLSARRINLVLLVVKIILKHGPSVAWLRRDPLADVHMLRGAAHRRSTRSRRRRSRPSSRRARAWWRPYFTVAFWTGARPNELAASKWGDVSGDQPPHPSRPVPGRGVARRRPPVPFEISRSSRP